MSNACFAPLSAQNELCMGKLRGCDLAATQPRPHSTKAALAQAASVTMSVMNAAELAYAHVQRLNRQQVAGDIVECGVYKGGVSAMMAISQLTAEASGKALGESVSARKLWLYDTFEGMSRPSSAKDGTLLVQQWQHIMEQGRAKKGTKGSVVDGKWTYGGGPVDVANTLARTGMPCERLMYMQGKVEDTLADVHVGRPESIALLRLDTDWYNSTRYELDVLLPRLAPGGVLIFDDLFETFAGRVDPRRPSACCSGLAATEYFPASLIARGVDMAKQLAFEGPSGHGGLRAPLQWHLVRSHLANDVVDRATGQRGPMTHDRYWATLNQTVQSWNSRRSL